MMELLGTLPEGEIIHSYELSNKNGLHLKVINYGATITALKIPLKNGEIIDVVLGFDTLDGYIKSFDLVNSPYFGTVVGRFAGRINDSTFTLNNQTYYLNKNNNNHSLHGGKHGFSQKVWKVKSVQNGANPSIVLTYCSPDREENYPGELSVSLTYTLSEENELIVEYVATTTKDTIINLTHHGYFNLEGHQSAVSDMDLVIYSKNMLQTTKENIPTGHILTVANTPFDFNMPTNCPSKIDTTFILEDKNQLAASLISKKNNLQLDVYTNQPAVHVYVGGFFSDTIKAKEEALYHSLSGICFETQNFPDAPNHEHFPSSVLKKGEEYYHKTVYKFQYL